MKIKKQPVLKRKHVWIIYGLIDNKDHLERTLFHSIYDISSFSLKIALLPGVDTSESNFTTVSLNKTK